MYIRSLLPNPGINNLRYVSLSLYHFPVTEKLKIGSAIQARRKVFKFLAIQSMCQRGKEKGGRMGGGGGVSPYSVKNSFDFTN